MLSTCYKADVSIETEKQRKKTRWAIASTLLSFLSEERSEKRQEKKNVLLKKVICAADTYVMCVLSPERKIKNSLLSCCVYNLRVFLKYTFLYWDAEKIFFKKSCGKMKAQNMSTGLLFKYFLDTMGLRIWDGKKSFYKWHLNIKEFHSFQFFNWRLLQKLKKIRFES